MQLRVQGNVREVLTLELGKAIPVAVVRFHVQASLSRLTLAAHPRPFTIRTAVGCSHC